MLRVSCALSCIGREGWKVKRGGHFSSQLDRLACFLTAKTDVSPDCFATPSLVAAAASTAFDVLQTLLSTP